MPKEISTNQTAETVTETDVQAEETAQKSEPTEKTISKAVYDKKVSELNAQLKALKAQAAEKMTDEEKRNVQYEEMQAQLAEANKAVLEYKTKSQLSQLGITAESVDTLTEALSGGGTDTVIGAFAKVIEAARKDAAAAAKKEALNGSFPKNVGKDNTDKSQTDAEKIESFAKSVVTPQQAGNKSKYFN